MHSYNIVERGSPIQKAKKALILLHGRGASAYDILALADEFVSDSFYVAAPQATNNTWYPNSFMANESKNEPWLSSSVEIVLKLIQETSKVIPLTNIYIMGFSQGACLSLETTARHPNAYGGVAAFSGGLIGEELNPEKYKGSFKNTPIFIGNSDVDPHIPLLRTQESAALLKKMGAQVTLKIYQNMPHTINEDEIETVRTLFNL
jgi:phospholipase/carboxylesterase